MQVNPEQWRGRIYTNVSEIIAKEGVGSIYRGLFFPALGFGAINLTVFGTRKVVSDFLLQREGNNALLKDPANSTTTRSLTDLENLMCGMTAGFTSSFVRTPIERVKTVMQVATTEGTKAPYRNSVACAMALVRKEGFFNGLFTGLNSTIAREIPQYSLVFVVYDYAKPFVHKTLFTDKNGSLSSTPTSIAVSQCLAGGITGCVSWIPPTYCMDVIKSRIQGAPDGTYAGLWDCAKKTYAKDGLKVFFRGLDLALMRAFPLHGCIFLGYEVTYSILNQHFPEENNLTTCCV
ncbi:hypothetical protein CYMTET_39247 [Cymbomonas tetramitiformis]|uniref:Mitochondrial carrier protein n=1 Tax=Cymbomonas tetramitiformis TaxID=36881 RepID=A0AAE0CAH0_9CHLO|nr:hypothetical protein CYMTET_39247 [Cymbomonas tetramitiformis]